MVLYVFGSDRPLKNRVARGGWMRPVQGLAWTRVAPVYEALTGSTQFSRMPVIPTGTPCFCDP